MKKIVKTAIFITTLVLSHPVAVFAVSEAQVQAAGKEKVAGSLFIWFLCAIAFLKISQKIDSFMSSLGVNVGHTGGSLMAEMLIAARGITTAKNISDGSYTGGNFFRKGGSTGYNQSNSMLSGGLAGAVGRQFTQSAVNNATGQGSNPISRKMFESSLQKGGDFANNVTGAVAQGTVSQTGSMQGPRAAKALSSYMGHTGIPDAPAYSNVEIGGGRILGTETSDDHPNGSAFGMYHADQYMAPSGNYETVTTADNAKWYRQYATDVVEKTPYMTGNGEIAYRQNIVQKLPEMPKRKDRV